MVRKRRSWMQREERELRPVSRAWRQRARLSSSLACSSPLSSPARRSASASAITSSVPRQSTAPGPQRTACRIKLIWAIRCARSWVMWQAEIEPAFERVLLTRKPVLKEITGTIPTREGGSSLDRQLFPGEGRSRQSSEPRRNCCRSHRTESSARITSSSQSGARADKSEGATSRCAGIACFCRPISRSSQTQLELPDSAHVAIRRSCRTVDAVLRIAWAFSCCSA